MQRQVLEGFDLRSFPAALLRPVNGQHVIRKLLSENQAGRVGLGLACRAAFKQQVCRLRWRRGTETGGDKEADGTEAQQARDTGDVCQCLLAERALQLVGSIKQEAGTSIKLN